LRVYRIASARYAPDNSEGARRVGGRWNDRGTAVIYVAATKSLAALEVLVHNGMVPADYRVINITIPDTLRIEKTDVAGLGEDWFLEASKERTASLGSAWAASLRSAVLEVPSAVIRSESNYILNPLHSDFREVVFEVSDSDEIDYRLRTLADVRRARGAPRK
jgi:RES domain-containing protein